MWRFILVSFAFLGWAFYSASGGADYEPMKGSLQNPKSQDVAVTKLDDTQKGAAAETAEKSAEKAISANEKELDETEALKLALNDVQASDEYDPNATLTDADPATDAGTVAGVEAEKVEGDENAENVAVTRVQFNSALDAFNGKPTKIIETAAGATGNIRLVNGNNVNLRSGPGTGFQAVDKLSSGTQVEIISGIGNDWVELQVVDSGQIGWMASRLLSTAKQ